MVPIPFHAKAHRWGLRTRLLTPIVVLVLVSVATLGLTSDLSSRALTELLVNQRAMSVLEGVTERLAERQRVQELLAELLSTEKDLAGPIEARDGAALAQLLDPLRGKLGLGRVSIFTADGVELLHVGHQESNLVLAPPGTLRHPRP